MQFILLLIFIYTVMSSSYLIYRVILYATKSKHYKTKQTSKKATIVIPHYNEEPTILDKVLQQALKTNHFVILVDDHSTKHLDKLKSIINKHKDNPFFLFTKNKYGKGKRYAQRTGIELATTEYIILMDSDTYITEKSINTLISYLEANPKLGGVTANIKLENRDENLLTKSISYRYTYAFEIERVAQSNHGITTCLSGVLSAVRKNQILPLLEKYTNQYFIKKRQEIGDDRHLTTLLLQQGYDIATITLSEAHTYAPNNLKQYIKQQIRWKQSFIRESIILMRTINPLKRPLLYFENAYTFILTYYAQFMRALGIVAVVLKPISLIFLSSLIVIIAVIRNLPLLFKNKREYFYGILYAFLYEAVISWTLLPATYNLLFKESKWLTR